MNINTSSYSATQSAALAALPSAGCSRGTGVLCRAGLRGLAVPTRRGRGRAPIPGDHWGHVDMKATFCSQLPPHLKLC